MRVSLFIACCLWLTVQAQEEVTPVKNFIDLTAGVSIPLGDYNADATLARRGRAANPGFGAKLGYGHLFGKKRLIGISSHVGFHLHPVSEPAFQFFLIDTMNMTTDANPYLHFPVTAGIFVSIPIKRIAFTFFTEAGTVIEPKSEYILYADNSQFIKVTNPAGVGVAFSAGVAPHIYISKRIALRPSIEYSYFKTRSSPTVFASGTGPSITTSEKYDRIAHILYVSLGMAVNF